MGKIVTYDEVYKFDKKLIEMVLKGYGTDEKAWKLFYASYIDPDGYPIVNNEYKMVGDIKCTADGILSINRIKQHEGFGENFVSAFTKYRKTPILFLPSEKYGINWLRMQVFGDRIDHTLFDLKNKCENKECKLEAAYSLPKTSTWLRHFNYDFKKIVGWLEIDDIFLEGDAVIDLECGRQTISEYKSSYSKKWSDKYYDNVKKKIEEFERKKIEIM